MTVKPINASELFNNQNNIYIDVEKVQRLSISSGETIVTSHKIVIRDDTGEEIVVVTVATLKEIFGFIQEYTYREIIKMTEKEWGFEDKFMDIANDSNGFFFCGDAYGLDALDTHHIEKLDI